MEPRGEREARVDVMKLDEEAMIMANSGSMVVRRERRSVLKTRV